MTSAPLNLNPLVDTFVDLRGTDLTDFSFLANFKRLTALNLSNTGITNLAPLEHVPSLRVLILRGTPITDLTPILKLSLNRLDISFTPIRDLEPLKSFRNLSCLVVSNDVLSYYSLDYLKSIAREVQIKPDVESSPATPEIKSDDPVTRKGLESPLAVAEKSVTYEAVKKVPMPPSLSVHESIPIRKPRGNAPTESAPPPLRGGRRDWRKDTSTLSDNLLVKGIRAIVNGVSRLTKQRTKDASLVSTLRGCYPEGDTSRDKVDCTVFAPTAARPGDDVLVQVFAHRPSDSDLCMNFALDADPKTAKRGARSLGTEIEQGSAITFELLTPNFNPQSQSANLVWRGHQDSAQFTISIPASQNLGAFVAQLRISVNTVPVGEIKFTIRIAKSRKRSEVGPVGTAVRYEQAFVSYASADREEVLSRVQMLTAAGIRYFQDVLNLDPGERWEKKLYRKIDQSDVMFLFWSSAAKSSEWVEKEWRYGLKRKGEDYIRPVILEGPPIPQPPDELKHLHFDDKVRYLIKALEQ